MRDRLLSELFPNFVKKEYLQSQRLSLGPFGEGLEKGRKYLKPGEQAPEGANVQTGPQGGQYYDEMGGGGAGKEQFLGGGAQGYDTDWSTDMYPPDGSSTEDRRMETQDKPYGPGEKDPTAALIDYGDSERAAQVREELDQQGMGVPPAPEAGPEISEDRIVYGGVDYGPSSVEPINVPDTASWAEYAEAQQRQEDQEAADLASAKAQGYSPVTIGTDLGDVPWSGEGDEGPFPGTDEWYEENREELEAKGKPTSHEELLAANAEEAKRSEGMYPKRPSPLRSKPDEPKLTLPPEQTSPPDVSEATFDGQGNIQTPGSDPYPVTEMISEGTDSESLSQVIDAYQNESGGKQSVPPIISEGYSGPLNRDSFEDHISNNQYEDFYITDNDYEDALGFFDWLESKAGTGVDEAGQTSPPDVSESSSASETTAEAVRRSEFASENNPQYSVYSNKYNADKAMEGVEDHLMDQGVSNDPHDIQGVLDEYADFWGIPQGESRNQLYDAGQQFMVDRAQDSAEQMTDYQMMAKMMQTYNVDNKRRDPIVLSNKGGRQRR